MHPDRIASIEVELCLQVQQCKIRFINPSLEIHCGTCDKRALGLGEAGGRGFLLTTYYDAMGLMGKQYYKGGNGGSIINPILQ